MMPWHENTDSRRVLVLTREEWLRDFDTFHVNGESVVGPRDVEVAGARATRGLRREVLKPHEGIEWRDVDRLVRLSDGKVFRVAEWWPMGVFYRDSAEKKGFNERPHLCVVEG